MTAPKKSIKRERHHGRYPTVRESAAFLAERADPDRRVVKRARFDRAARSFYDSIDLPAFKQSLEFGADPRYQMLHAALSSPMFRIHSFPDLVRRCKLTLRDVAVLWRDYNLSLGTSRMSGFVPQIMEDIAKDALSRTYTCPDCDGTGRAAASGGAGVSAEGSNNGGAVGGANGKPGKRPPGGLKICKTCRGDGKIRELGDRDARAQVFEAMGLRKPASISQTVVVGAPQSVEDAVGELERVFETAAVVVSSAVAEPSGGGASNDPAVERQNTENAPKTEAGEARNVAPEAAPAAVPE